METTLILPIALGIVLAIIFTSTAAKYLDDQQLWTVRLYLSTFQHRFVIAVTLAIPSLLACELAFHFPYSLAPYKLPAALVLLVGTAIGLVGYTLPAYNSRAYIRLRWKAWTGPSRTGIAGEFVRYIGTRYDWQTLNNSLSPRDLRPYPVEAFTGLITFWRRGYHYRTFILSDPTDLLKVRATKELPLMIITSSTLKDGVFQPIRLGEPASLLWGEHLGFARRCSRGIISVPRNLLGTSPMMAGLDGRGVCLACGVLARNKGPNPASLVCNLLSKNKTDVIIRSFEEHSLFWPRPAKTLRSLLFREFERFFSLLGPAYVAAATELALLLTDVPVEVAEDWLDGNMEHQDLALNNKAYALGAAPDDLDRLYRGHYAVMLVSLSVHRVGVRVRPEILVYDALCRSEKVERGAWAMSASVEARRQREMDELGPNVLPLIDAII